MSSDWRTESLGDVCEVITRGIAPIYVESGGLRVVNQKCVRDHTIDYGLARRHNVYDKPVPIERLIRPGDVLVNSTGTGTLGRVAQVRIAPDEPTTVDTHVTIVRPKANLFHLDFFGYVMTTIEAALTAAGEGASGQTELPRSKLENDFEIKFPESVAEQRRIVAILDEAFEGIEEAVRSVRRKLVALAELKKSVLVRAFSGELSATKDNAFATSEQAANVMALMYWYHERANRNKTYGHVKAQKGLHLLEWTGGANLGRNPIKDAAGPNDFAHMRAAEAWAKSQGFFEFVQRGGGYDFKKLPNYSRLLTAARAALRPIENEIKRVSDLIVPLDTEGAEALATVHAAWNNLLVDSRDVTPEAIIREAREDWGPSKSKFSDSDFLRAIEQIKASGIVPDGSANPIRHKQGALF